MNASGVMYSKRGSECESGKKCHVCYKRVLASVYRGLVLVKR